MHNSTVFPFQNTETKVVHNVSVLCFETEQQFVFNLKIKDKTKSGSQHLETRTQRWSITSHRICKIIIIYTSFCIAS